MSLSKYDGILTLIRRSLGEAELSLSFSTAEVNPAVSFEKAPSILSLVDVVAGSMLSSMLLNS